MTAEDKVRVIVADDHPVWRDGVRPTWSVGAGRGRGRASDGGEAIELALEPMPELVLMDLQLPTVTGAEATRLIVEESPHVKVLVLSASAEEADVLEAVKVGAAGYLLKSSTRPSRWTPWSGCGPASRLHTIACRAGA